MLIAFSGLPGSGKTSLARALASHLGACYVQIDAVEEQLLGLGGKALVDNGAGCCVAYAIAEDNLRLVRTVVADSANPARLTREAWKETARRCGTGVVEVLVVCSDQGEHQRRIEARPREASASCWREVTTRAFDAAEPTAVVVDTGKQTVEQSLAGLLDRLSSN